MSICVSGGNTIQRLVKEIQFFQNYVCKVGKIENGLAIVTFIRERTL